MFRKKGRTSAVALQYGIMQKAERKMRAVKDICYEDVVSFEALMEAAESCRRGVNWKASTQMFWANQLRWCATLHRELKEGSYHPKGFTEFDISERGKTRHIRSVHITERCVQKSLVQNALRPAIEPRLIYDNSASIEGKGTEFALKRLKQHLARHYRKHRRSGGILVMDYAGFFDSISHRILLNMLEDVLEDERVFELTKMFIDAFPGEYGLGLGSEVSQTCAIFYPNKIDHYVKERLHIEGYARYMDDSYVIHEDLDYLQHCRDEIERIASEDLELRLNPKRTMIVRFDGGSFCYLKKRIRITESGKILMRLSRENVTRHRRKLKRLAKKNVDPDSARQTHQSWRGYAEKYDTRDTVGTMDDLFRDLFGGE